MKIYFKKIPVETESCNGCYFKNKPCAEFLDNNNLTCDEYGKYYIFVEVEK